MARRTETRESNERPGRPSVYYHRRRTVHRPPHGEPGSPTSVPDRRLHFHPWTERSKNIRPPSEPEISTMWIGHLSVRCAEILQSRGRVDCHKMPHVHPNSHPVVPKRG